MLRRLAVACAVLSPATLFFPGPVALSAAHRPTLDATEGQQPTFSSRALGMRVDVLVTDGRKPVAGSLLDAGPLALAGGAEPISSQRQTIASADALDRWVDEVRNHIPGQPDASAQAVVAMTYPARIELNTSCQLFIRVLRGEVVTTRDDFEKRVTALGRAVRLGFGTATFLRSAAVLHADAVILADRFPPSPDDAPLVQGSHQGGPDDRADTRPGDPLLIRERVVLTRDGQVIGDIPANWNLPFARSLLDLLREQPGAHDEFVSQWYHTISAFLFSKHMNGDATSHLGQAERVLPDDANALFDRGTYAETLGLPVYQAVNTDPSVSRRSGFSARIPLEERTNQEAERLYRRVLEIDPAFVEARVRLARLLDHRGQHEEAAAEIAIGLDAGPSGVVGFYAHIVAGRIATARARYEEALAQYRAASRLYRSAQSAVLGESHAALMLAEVPETLATLEALSGGAVNSDPWWDYQLGCGRDVDELIRQLWSMTR